MDIATLTERLQALEAENERLTGRVRDLEARAERSPAEDGEAPIDRRALLKRLGGAAVAGAGLAAGAGLVRGDPAAAATNGNFILGQPNTAESQTGLTSSASTGSALHVSTITGNTDGVTGTSQGGRGVVGVGSNGYGVYGLSGTSNAVVGQIIALPSPAPVNNFSAIFGTTATAGAGIHGMSENGWGVVGEMGPGGRGQLWLKPGTSPEPPGGLNRVGEFYVGSGGALYECAAEGEPGTWLRVGFNPIEPVRICDTRDDAEANPLNTYGAQRLEPRNSPGDTLAVTVTGPIGEPPTVIVPPQASAVVLNVTATNITSAGFLTVYPAGSARPLVSNVNFPGPSVPLPAVPNSVVVKLGTLPSSQTGISIFNGSFGPLDVIVDVAGFFS